MHPVLFTIGALTVNWYGVMMAVGFATGLANWVLLGKREGRDYNFCADLLFWIMVAGILGARIAYIVSDLKWFLAAPVTMLYLHEGGLIYYGGFLGAIPAIFLFARRRGERPLAVFDFVVTSVPLAHAFGRVGCFLNGCCFGSLCKGGWSVRYPAGSYPWNFHVYHAGLGREELCSLSVHPVQLYEAAFNLCLAVFLVVAYRRRRLNGSVTALYLMTYPVGRFFLELLRGDDRVRLAGFSVAQYMSLVLFAIGGILMAIVWRKESEAQRRC